MVTVFANAPASKAGGSVEEDSREGMGFGVVGGVFICQCTYLHV